MLFSGEKVEKLSPKVKVIISKEFTFGTDTLILANFALPKKYEITVDIGTGCGAIPLYWLSVTETNKIFAIDIQKKACDQLKRSIKISDIEGKIEIINESIKNDIPQILRHSCDLVVCNPPYKTIGSGITSKITERLVARHEQECTIDDIVRSAEKFLNFWGRLCMCHRVERLCDVIEVMRKYKIEPKKIRFVQQRKNSHSKLFLIEGKKGAKPGLVALPTLFIENEFRKLSNEMNEIYKCYGEKL